MLGTVTEQPRSSPPESTEMHRMDARVSDREVERLDGSRSDAIHADLGVLKHTDRVTVQQTVESVGKLFNFICIGNYNKDQWSVNHSGLRSTTIS